MIKTCKHAVGNIAFSVFISVFIFPIIYKGILLTFQQMTWVVLTKLQLLRFKATFGTKICTEDVQKDKNLKFQRLKSLFLLMMMLWTKRDKSGGIRPLA